MLRTNQKFLDFIQGIYDSTFNGNHIILKSFLKGQKLLHQDQITHNVMLLQSGITKCFFNEENDKEFIVEFLGKGEIIGEIESIRQMPCLCSVEAITNVSAFVIPSPYFQELLNKDLHLNKLLLEAFAERIVNTSSRAAFQQLYTVEHSLSKLLELQSKQEIQLSKEEMAAYLGISVRSLNRSLKNMIG